ncbi:Ig-like domain-containing protein, partial [Demetria terragena]|uniref:Ig-like domain-containing protein n=1 Tax=Demetria terragena TaxID=63959 RepID=UPI00037FD7FB
MAWATKVVAVVALSATGAIAVPGTAAAAETDELIQNNGAAGQTGGGQYQPLQFPSSPEGGLVGVQAPFFAAHRADGVEFRAGDDARARVNYNAAGIVGVTDLPDSTVTASNFSIIDIDSKTYEFDIEVFDSTNAPVAPANVQVDFIPRSAPESRMTYAATDNGDGTMHISMVDSAPPTAGATDHSTTVTISSTAGLAGRVAYSNFSNMTWSNDLVRFSASRVVTTPDAATPPTANPDTGTTPQNTPVTVPLTENDTPGDAPIDPALTTLLDDAGNPVDTRTIPDVGTFTVDDSGNVVFTPLPEFTGTTPAVPYRITDENGETADSTVTVTVTPTAADPPVASPDSDTTPQGTPVDVPLLDNDTAGSAPIDPALTTLLDPAGNPVDELTVPGEGTYTVNDQGVVTFTPLPDFTGEATPVPYRITDENGETADSTVAITVTPQDAVPPVANPDEGTTPLNTPVDVPLLDNDTAGDTPIVPGETTLLDGAGEPVDEVTVQDVGTFTVNDEGVVTFTPVDGFTGTTPAVPYRIFDEDGDSADSTVTVTVEPGAEPVPPVANPDSETTPQNTPVTYDPNANDDGVDSDIDPSQNTYLDENGDPTDTVTVPGEGVWTIESDGQFTFT